MVPLLRARFGTRRNSRICSEEPVESVEALSVRDASTLQRGLWRLEDQLFHFLAARPRWLVLPKDTVGFLPSIYAFESDVSGSIDYLCIVWRELVPNERPRGLFHSQIQQLRLEHLQAGREERTPAIIIIIALYSSGTNVEDLFCIVRAFHILWPVGAPEWNGEEVIEELADILR